MGNAGVFFSIILFMFLFNGLVGMYAISDPNIEDDISKYPKIDEEPDVLDYLSYPFEWAYYVFGLTIFTISELPIWLSGVVVAIDLTLAFILISLVRGSG